METITLEREAARRAEKAGVPAEIILPTVRQQLDEHPFQIRYESLSGDQQIAEVLFIERDSGQEPAIRVTFNLRHPWVIDVMLGHHTTKQQRAGMEIALCTILGARNGLTDDEKRFYTQLHNDVSGRLGTAIKILFEPGKDGLDMFGNDPYADYEEEDDEDGN